MKPGRPTKCALPLNRDERKASQGYVDIKSKTTEQLDELIQRQNKLLQNRFFLEKLPDKGQKILSFKTELEIERRKKQIECDAACKLLYNLTLNDINVDEMEWNQEKSIIHKEHHKSYEDCKDEIGLLKIVANHSGTASGLSTHSGNNFSVNPSESKVKKILYIDKFCEKYGKADKCKERFKPNQFRNNNRSVIVSSAEKVKKTLGSKWEVTEATPPVPVHNDTVMISLSESLKLQKEQAEKLLELNKKHAMEKLLENTSIKMGNKLPISNITQYRSNDTPFNENADDDDDDDDDDNDNDDCDDNDDIKDEHEKTS